MSTTLRLPKLDENRISSQIGEKLRELKIDPKQFEQDLKMSTAKIREMAPTLEGLEPSTVEFFPPQPVPTESFAYLARLAINDVTVIVHKPQEAMDAHFQTGELSRVDVEIRNTCGLPLRDIVVALHATGPVTVLPSYLLFSVNPRHIARLERNAAITLPFFVIARDVTSITPAKLHAHLTGEVVPYVSRSFAYSPEFEVWPID